MVDDNDLEAGDQGEEAPDDALDDLEEDSDLDEDEDLDEDFEEDEGIEALEDLDVDLDDHDDDVVSDDDEDEDDIVAPVVVETGDEDEDVDPSDVEAGLDEILRDRIAAGDDEDDDEDEDGASPEAPAAVVAPKRSGEWTCPQCFLIVSSSQFGTRDDPRCPSGEDPCPSIKRALKG